MDLPNLCDLQGMVEICGAGVRGVDLSVEVGFQEVVLVFADAFDECESFDLGTGIFGLLC